MSIISGPVWSGEVAVHSEPSIEAPDGSTLSRQVKAKPQHTTAYQEVQPGLRRRRQRGVVILRLRHGLSSPSQDRNPSKAVEERRPSGAQNGFGSRVP